ncbi:unnamed protein product [Camellia sinensis]
MCDHLIYWICEHTKIIKPNDKNAIPRFEKWNITHLGEQLAKSSLHDLKHIEMMSMKMNNVTLRNKSRLNYLKRKKNQLSERYSVSVQEEIHRIPSIKQYETEEGSVHVQRNELSFDKLENDEEETMIKQKVGPTTSPGFKHQTSAEKRKAKRKLAYETNVYHVKINEHTFQKLEENVFIMQRLEMEKARTQAENDELKDQLMKLNKQMEEQSKKTKTQMEVKDVEIVLLNERIAMLVESNVYLDSQEKQIAVEIEATTPKTSPLVSSMIKMIKNRETRKEHKDPDFWYTTERQPKQNKTVDEVEPMVEESAKTRKEEQTQHQHSTKEIDTSYPVFHKLPKKSRMKLTSLWATKTSSYPILEGKEVGSYLYLDDIDKIVKYEELSGNAINAYKEILMTEEQPKPKFSLSSQAGTTYIFTTSCHYKEENESMLRVLVRDYVGQKQDLILQKDKSEKRKTTMRQKSNKITKRKPQEQKQQANSKKGTKDRDNRSMNLQMNLKNKQKQKK